MADFLKEPFLKTYKPPPSMFLVKFPNYSEQLVKESTPRQLLSSIVSSIKFGWLSHIRNY